MFVAYGFKMGKVEEGRFYDHTPLGAGDIIKLEKIFPNNPIWKAKTNEVGNVYFPTSRQALSFYKALLEYAQTHTLSQQNYVAGNTTSGSDDWVVHNLRDVIEGLIRFFEKELMSAGVLPPDWPARKTSGETAATVLALSVTFSAPFA